MKISFFQRGSKVQVRVSDGNSNSVRMSTDIKVLPHHKFNDKFVGKTPEIETLNAELDRNRSMLSELFIQYRDLEKVKKYYSPEPTLPAEAEDDEDNYELIHLLRQYLYNAGKGTILTKGKKRYSDATLRAYSYATGLLHNFTKANSSITLTDFHIDIRLDMKSKRRVVEKWNEYFMEFEDYMLEMEIGMRTRQMVLNNINIMINYWARIYYLTIPRVPFQSVEDNGITVLPFDFTMDFISDKHKLYDTLNDDLKATWEVCVAILVTTLRIGDAVALTQQKFKFTKDGLYLYKENGKTKEISDAPLFKKVELVFRDNLARKGTLFSTKVSHTFVYNHIKVLFKMYEEMHDIATIIKIGLRGEFISEHKPYYEIVHPHMLRKTAISMMLHNGVSERHIKYLSGHKDRSVAFEKYVSFNERNFNSEIGDYFKKIER